MKHMFLFIFSIVLSSQVFAADDFQYRLTVIRDTKRVNATAFKYWSGEYPGPVIEVTQPTTKVQAYLSLRRLTAQRECIITPGLYHPWARVDQAPSSVRAFYSLHDYMAFESIAEITQYQGEDIPDLVIPAGSKFENAVYAGEGNFSVLVTLNGKTTEIYFGEDELMDATKMKQIAGPRLGTPADQFFYEQWIQLNCAGGGRAWIRDQELLKAPGVREGQITGYGEIEGAEYVNPREQ